MDATHTPNDAARKESGRRNSTGTSPLHWDFPMLPKRFVEASCLKCHHQVDDLIRDGTKDEAEKLIKGYNLVQELGCFGCHEIPGMKSGREVGPDLRLEPEPPLDALSPEERAKLLADTANPPGTCVRSAPACVASPRRPRPNGR